MLIKNRTLSALLFALPISIATLATMSADEVSIALPGIACTLMVFWLWMSLSDRDRAIPFYDVGMLCALAIFLYSVYPLVNYWFGDFQFGPLSDNRLQRYNPTPAELGSFYIRHVIYLFFFVTFYSLFRGKSTITTGTIRHPSHLTAQIIVGVFITLTGYFALLQVLTGVNYNTSYDAESYSAHWTAIRSIPLIVLQISSKLNIIVFIVKIALLFLIILRCNKKKWLRLLLIWIMVEILLTFLVKGSRTQLVLFLLASALLYHRIIKPLTMKFVVTSGILLFTVFLFLGLYRAYYNVGDWRLLLAFSKTGILTASNEFQSLLGTSYDVLRMKQSGTIIPWYLKINDFATILPPQQLLPFEKIRASEWYLREIGKSGTGQGYMWGVISQSIVGFDMIELAVRGSFLGFILAKFHRWYVKNQTGFMETIFYTYICLKVYYTFRESTGILLSVVVWEIIPFYLIIRIAKAMVSHPVRRTAVILPDTNPRS